MTASQHQHALAQYRELCRKLDDKFTEIRSRYSQEFTCRLGCHSCCLPGLTVSALEAENLRAFFRERPENFELARALGNQDPHGGTRCRFLDAQGACVVYEARPLVCRSHGAPLQTSSETRKEERIVERDACPLNFTGLDITCLPPDAVLNLDTLNTLLSVLTRMAFPGDETRTPLSINALRP